MRAEQVATLAKNTCKELASNSAEAQKWARNLKIQQEKSKMSTPADKRSLGYILDEKFDLQDLFKALKEISPAAEGQPFITAQNFKIVESTLAETVLHVEKRMRKNKREEESYRIANKSQFGWKTEKMFREDDTFKDDEDDTNWWTKPDLSAEKKLEKFKSSEREVKFQQNLRKSFSSGGKSAEPLYGGASSSRSVSLLSRAKPYTQSQDRSCHHCGALGHIKPNCFKFLKGLPGIQRGGAQGFSPRGGQFSGQGSKPN